MKLVAPAPDPAVAFAREALRRSLVTREQAEECASAARALARQGKRTPVEQVFLSKGYLSRGDARAIAARVAKAAPAPAPLELAPEDERRECRACRRDPGVGDDCRYCGADVATGAPGPDATACGGCGQVLRLGTAFCTRCAAPIARPGRRYDTSYGPFLGRVALLAGVLGVAYFLVWRPLHAGAAALAAPDEGPIGERAAALLEAGQPDRALALLEAAVAGDDDERLAARRALAYAARAAGRADQARAVARGAVDRTEDPALRVLLADLALDRDQAAEARTELGRVPAGKRDDGWRRVEARRRRAAGEDAVEPLDALGAPAPDDRLALALALAERALTRARARDADPALADAARARGLAPDAAPVRLRCGLALAALGRHRDALADLGAACKAAPADPGAHLARGVSLEASADRAGAAAAYREYLRLAGTDPAQRDRAARVQARLEALR